MICRRPAAVVNHQVSLSAGLDLVDKRLTRLACLLVVENEVNNKVGRIPVWK